MEDTNRSPSPERAKARLMVQCAHWLRSGWEVGQGERLPDPKDLLAWVSRLAPEADASEIANHALPVGEWPDQLTMNGTWAKLSGTTIEWALGLKDDFGEWDEPEWWSDAVHDDFPGFPDPAQWRHDLRLRSWEELERQAMIMETCLWRLRQGPQPDPDAAEYVKKLLARSAAIGHVRLAPDGDLRCSDGRSLADQSDEEAQEILSIVTERLHALNWLTGQEEHYGDITCNTIVGWLWDEEP